MALEWIAGIVAGAGVLTLLDRLLLGLEGKGWINYRRNKLGRGGGLYHMLDIHSIYDPGIRQIIEAKYGEEHGEEEHSADPPVAGSEQD